MKITSDDIMKMNFDPSISVNIKFPAGLLRRIDARAQSELTNRSAWLKKLAVNALKVSDE
jgi:hypothetical protein